VDAGWRDAMAAALQHDAFVTGRIEVPPHQTGTARPVAIKDDEEPARLDATTTGTLGHSASLGVRRAVLERIGGFDESLGAGARFQSAPEVDLFDRLFAAGFTGRYEPAARAWHEQWRSPEQKVHLDWRYGIGTGARVVKLLRSDRRRAFAVARDAAWDRGLRRAATDLRAGYRLGAATALARTAGVVVGALRAAPVPVRDGHFVEHR
jgi:GT2 family glycosyltransferase